MILTCANLRFEQLSPPWFWALLVLAAVALLVFAYRGMYQRTGRKLAWTLLGMRLFAVAVLMLALVKPSWHSITLRKQKPTVAVIVDTSQSMSLPGASGVSAGGQSRYAQMLHWLDDSSAARALHEKFDVEMFDITGQPITAGRPPAQPLVQQTDLSAALTAVASHERGRHVAGVVLISDGRNTTDDHHLLALKDLALPTYALGFGRAGGKKSSKIDIALTAVQAPKRVLVHNSAAIKVTVRKDGGGAIELPLKITRDGKILATKRITLRAGRIEKQTIINYTPNQAGDFVLTAEAAPPAGDRVASDNTRPFKLHVDDKPIRVLYIEGVLRPEYTYLRSRLGRDPDVDLITFVRAAHVDELSSGRALLNGKLISAARLKKLDVVLLGDFDAHLLSDGAYRALAVWVRQGGGLMILGGYHNLSADGLGRTPLGPLLPVKVNRGAGQIHHLFAMSLTGAGKRAAMLSITGNSDQDARLWQALPPLLGLVVTGGVKPGATVLARAANLINPETDKPYPVLISEPIGKGRVMVLTADSTWRWSRLVRLEGRPDTLYARFWSQIIRALAKRDNKNQRPALTIDTDKVSYRRGQPVKLTVHENPAGMLPVRRGQKSALSLSVHRPDGRITDLPLAQSPSDPRRFTARFFPEHGGRFTVSAELTRHGAGPSHVIANQQTRFIVEGSAVEMADPAPDPTALRQIGRITGGGYAPLDQSRSVASLLDKLPTAPRITRQVHASQLWDSPGLFLVFLVLIAGEWVIRRRHRLV